MRTAFGKVLVGYEVPVDGQVNAQLLADVYFSLPGVVAHTPASIQGGIWQMAVYYTKETRDDPAGLRDQFQEQLGKRLGRRVEVRWFNVGP